MRAHAQDARCTRSGSVPANPMHGTSSWAAENGQDFIVDHSNPNIDYMSFHGWPDLWNVRVVAARRVAACPAFGGRSLTGCNSCALAVQGGVRCAVCGFFQKMDRAARRR
jgi:hypothetical protein